MPAFLDRGAFAPGGSYRLLPLRFERLDEERYLVTNDVGEHCLVSPAELRALIDHTLPADSAAYRALKARHFLFDECSRSALDLLALKYRTRAERVACFTGLHMFVVTLRCDHSCRYCQVSRQAVDRLSFDMSTAHADRALDFTFRSPSPTLKIEFQGGEPLLNFDLVRHIVTRALEMNRQHQRQLAFVIASNLSRLTDEILSFCARHGVMLSTSLDGPADLHDGQRLLRGGSSYHATVRSIQNARAVLGHDAVAALMTTTPASLRRVEEVIDEYVRQGFHSIFLRSLSPYGFAVRNSLTRCYAADDWVEFYQRGLRHILDINRRGYLLREEYTAILLQKIFSPEGSAYVDLQSPAGLGISALVYNYDGAVYASDEGRMLAEMGDRTFRLGHLDEHSYEEVMTSDRLVSILHDTMPEGVPRCSDCAFLPYCGADPVRHQATQGDPIGHKAFSEFCRKQTGVLRHLFTLLEGDRKDREQLLQWVD